jgi:large subunit ribosomal protein L28e
LVVEGVKEKMATVPGPLVWEIVKKNNSFLVKEFGNNTQSVQFSRESNNLYNLNSYKFSGIILFFFMKFS